jgi:hypothetical protein
MAGTQTLAPLHKADLTSCTVAQLRDLTWAYYGDPESLQLVLDEYARRGFDPYGA